MNRAIKIILISLLVLSAMIASYYYGRKSAKKQMQIAESEIQHDTIIVRDTLHIDHFREVTKMISDTIKFAITDTIKLHDTTYVLLPRSVKEYSSAEFKAQVSGYEPSLDWIDVYPETKYITTTIHPKPKRWGVGVNVGYGISKQGLSPYIGVGVSYNLWSW